MLQNVVQVGSSNKIISLLDDWAWWSQPTQHWKCNEFTRCGREISRTERRDVVVSQGQYVRTLDPVALESRRNGEMTDKLEHPGAIIQYTYDDQP